MLELEGQPAGFLTTVEGGEPFAPVVNEAVGASGVVRKHIGSPEFAPMRMSFGTGMSESLYKWMADVLNHNRSDKNGAIVFCDYNFKERSRLMFDNALITEIAFPALDAGSKDAAYFTLTLQPRATRISKASIGSSVHGFGGKKQQHFSSANFRLKIAGLEAACARVSKIDAIIVKQPATQRDFGENRDYGVTSEVLTIPNVVFTLGETQAEDFYDWFVDFVINGNNAQENERAGTLEFLDANLRATLFTLTLSNLGILRIQKERIVGEIDVTARVRVELYCEEMAFNSAQESLGSTVTPSASETSPIVSTNSSVNIPPTEILLGIISGRIRGEEALRATLRIAGSAQILNSNEIAESEVVARRLLATAPPMVFSPSAPKYDDGVLIGERWAAEKATLKELDQVSALVSGEWTAIRLENEHSLIVQLSEAGVIPPGGDGPIDLERDNFVEGIVAGASRVLRSVAPHLSRPK